MAEYLVCPCCDAGRDAYDAAEAVDPTSAECLEETCDDCMGGKACTVPNLDQFSALLERRDALRDQHEAYCDDVNGRLGAGERSPEASGRDRVWRELKALEEKIQAELDAERAAEGED